MSHKMVWIMAGLLAFVLTASLYQYDQQRVQAGYGRMRADVFLLSGGVRRPDMKCEDLYLYTVCVFVKDSKLLSVTCPNAKAVAREQCVGRVETSWRMKARPHTFRHIPPHSASRYISM